jgi:hypothetical protein
MKAGFFPKTKYGIWSAILFLALVLFAAYFILMVGVFNQRGGDTFFSNPNLTLPVLAAWAAGLASLILGLIAIIKSKSKSILVFIIVVLTFLTTVCGVLGMV